jgi:hypothetical protein
MSEATLIPKEEVELLWKMLVPLLNEPNECYLVIACGAKVEELLRDAVSPIADDMGFKKSVKALELLGLLHENTATGLRCLWDLRCAFAHDPVGRSLSDSSCEKDLAKMRNALGPGLDNAREKIDSAGIGHVADSVLHGMEVRFQGSEDARYLAIALLFFGIHLLVARAQFPDPKAPADFWSVKVRWE